MSGETKPNTELDLGWCRSAIAAALHEKLPSGILVYVPSSVRDFDGLAATEYEHAQNFSASARRDEFLRGRLALRMALTRYGATRSPPILPHPLGYPQLPSPLIGTVTHKRGEVLALIGTNVDSIGIGIDIEHTIPQFRSQRLAEWLGLSFELTETTSDAERASFVLATFSARESAIKASSIAFDILPGIHSVSVEWGDYADRERLREFTFSIPWNSVSSHPGKRAQITDTITGSGYCASGEDWLLTAAVL